MRKGLQFSAYGLLAVAITACTGTTVLPGVTTQYIPRTYSVAVINEIKTSDPEWRSYATDIRRTFISELAANQSFSQVLDSTANLNESALVVSGQVSTVDKGTAWERWIIGLGAGHALIIADFQVSNSNGAALASYSVRKTYAGGAGIGGGTVLNMDDLAEKLGKEAARSLASWVKTGQFVSR